MANEIVKREASETIYDVIIWVVCRVLFFQTILYRNVSPNIIIKTTDKDSKNSMDKA